MTNYIYHNSNPNLDITDDCVCRAIKLATGLNYNTVINLLGLTSRCYGGDKLSLACYRHLLEDIFQFRNYRCFCSETVSDISRYFGHSTLLIRIDGHLTCSIQGSILDIWDCSDKLVDTFWIVE